MKSPTNSPVPLFGYGLILLQILVLCFHFIVIFGVIDFHHVWGGRLTNVNEMLVFESISIGLNAFLLWVVLQRFSVIRLVLSKRILSAILWAFSGIFALNTLGNLFAHSLWEQIFGSLFTVISALFCYGAGRAKTIE